MSEETLIKYLEFLKTECLRHSNDKLVNENEIQLFKLEVNKFISLFQNSKFESSIKEKVLNIHFDFSIPKYKGTNLLSYIIDDSWTNSRQREEIMSKKFIRISEEIGNSILEIKATI
jgi:hypothetical protein